LATECNIGTIGGKGTPAASNRSRPHPVAHLDALAVAVTARFAAANPMTLPAHPKTDRKGLSMQVVCAAPP
jgi:predicted RNase H-like nuclease